jgi:hypothetical protein
MNKSPHVCVRARVGERPVSSLVCQTKDRARSGSGWLPLQSSADRNPPCYGGWGEPQPVFRSLQQLAEAAQRETAIADSPSPAKAERVDKALSHLWGVKLPHLYTSPRARKSARPCTAFERPLGPFAGTATDPFFPFFAHHYALFNSLRICSARCMDILAG